MKTTKKLAQVRIYETDRDKFAVQAKRKRTTIAEIVSELGGRGKKESRAT